jgi:hypothetical protein
MLATNFSMACFASAPVAEYPVRRRHPAAQSAKVFQVKSGALAQRPLMGDIHLTEKLPAGRRRSFNETAISSGAPISVMRDKAKGLPICQQPSGDD